MQEEMKRFIRVWTVITFCIAGEAGTEHAAAHK